MFNKWQTNVLKNNIDENVSRSLFNFFLYSLLSIQMIFLSSFFLLSEYQHHMRR